MEIQQTNETIKISRAQWTKDAIVTSWTGGTTWIRYKKEVYYILCAPREIFGIFNGGFEVEATKWREKESV